jgi:hypothetical protein
VYSSKTRQHSKADMVVSVLCWRLAQLAVGAEAHTPKLNLRGWQQNMTA